MTIDSSVHVPRLPRKRYPFEPSAQCDATIPHITMFTLLLLPLISPRAIVTVLMCRDGRRYGRTVVIWSLVYYISSTSDVISSHPWKVTIMLNYNELWDKKWNCRIKIHQCGEAITINMPFNMDYTGGKTGLDTVDTLGTSYPVRHTRSTPTSGELQFY